MKQIIIFFFCLTPFISNAQNSGNKKDTTIVIELEHSKYDNKYKKKKSVGEVNTIKIAPLGFVSGTFPLYFERVVSDFFTVQAGVGLTSRNYIRNAIQQVDQISNIVYPWGDNYNVNDQADLLYDFPNRTARIGYMLSIQPRVYFDSDAPDGGFMGVSYDYSHYSTSIPGMVKDNNGNYFHRGPIKKEHENLTDLMVYFGYQDVHDRVSVEYLSGIGIRNAKGSKYAFGTGYDNSGNPIDPIEGFATYKQTTFNFNIGIRIGYHF